MEKSSLKFWGVRGSYPTAQREMLGVGGNTASVEITTPHVRLLLDAGTGIIAAGRDIVRAPHIPLALLLTHWHHDHLQGLPFFAPLFRPNTQLAIAAPAADEADLMERLRRVMGPPQFPVEWSDTRAAKQLYALDDALPRYLYTDGSFGYAPQRGALVIRTLHTDAHPNGVTLYRIEYRGTAIVYATDVESDANHAAEIVEFARDADLLIHDAQYQREQYLGLPPFTFSTHGYGHSTNEMAATIANAANVKQLVLFHHDPNNDDDTIARILAQTRVWFPNTLAAREGMVLSFRTVKKGVNHVSTRSLDAPPTPTV